MSNAKGWLRAIYTYDIPSGEGRAVQIGSREIAIFNLGDRFLAVENRCPHKGGPLADGIVSGSAVICPLHAWKFCLDTGEGVSPASRLSCVHSFPTRIERGVVLVQINLESNADGARLPDISALCSGQERAPSGDSAPSAT